MKNIFVTFAFSLSVLTVGSVIVRRQYHDGMLYEDYAPEAQNVRYTTTSGHGWDNLDTLIEKERMSGKAMFCSRGPGAYVNYCHFSELIRHLSLLHS